MKTFKQYIVENTTEDITPTMTLWHGGNLNDIFNDSLHHKKGKWEYGPGLYLTTHYDTARQYAKGNRKLYKVVVKKGNNIDDVYLNKQLVYDFINNNVINNKKETIKQDLTKFNDKDKIPAFILNNLIINYNALQSSKINNLRTFLIENGVDYVLVPNAFGWREMMLVLFNMKKIANITQIKSTDKINEFDLPTEFK
jgi:hypothetical protein